MRPSWPFHPSCRKSPAWYRTCWCFLLGLFSEVPHSFPWELKTKPKRIGFPQSFCFKTKAHTSTFLPSSPPDAGTVKGRGEQTPEWCPWLWIWPPKGRPRSCVCKWPSVPLGWGHGCLEMARAPRSLPHAAWSPARRKLLQGWISNKVSYWYPLGASRFS